MTPREADAGGSLPLGGLPFDSLTSCSAAFLAGLMKVKSGSSILLAASDAVPAAADSAACLTVADSCCYASPSASIHMQLVHRQCG